MTLQYACQKFFFSLISQRAPKNIVNLGGYTVHLGNVIKLTMINGFISSTEWLPYLRNFQSMQTALIHPLSCRLEMSGYKAKLFLHSSPQTPWRNQVAVSECVIGRTAAFVPLRKSFYWECMQINNCALHKNI